MSFHVGQKIVCIRDNWSSAMAPGEEVPRKGAIYTVRGMQIDLFGQLGLYLREIHNPKIQTTEGFQERQYDAFAFRPIVEKKTDISIFTAMLTPSGRKLETVMTDDARLTRSPGIESENPSSSRGSQERGNSSGRNRGENLCPTWLPLASVAAGFTPIRTTAVDDLRHSAQAQSALIPTMADCLRRPCGAGRMRQ